VAERVSAEIVNLPVDLAPGGSELRAVQELLEACAERIA
jgi:hypothetical protein